MNDNTQSDAATLGEARLEVEVLLQLVEHMKGLMGFALIALTCKLLADGRPDEAAAIAEKIFVTGTANLSSQRGGLASQILRVLPARRIPEMVEEIDSLLAAAEEVDQAIDDIPDLRQLGWPS